MSLDQELARVSSSTSFSLAPPTFKTTLDNKLDHLYEITTLPEDQKIYKANLPIINSYHAFTKKQSSTIRSIRTLIKLPTRTIKESVQASKFDQHPLQAILGEQFVTLQIPAEFPLQGISQGFTHISILEPSALLSFTMVEKAYPLQSD